jgi:hypothetical protein
LVLNKYDPLRAVAGLQPAAGRELMRLEGKGGWNYFDKTEKQFLLHSSEGENDESDENESKSESLMTE